MTNLDPTLAYTAVMELRPGHAEGRQLSARLAEAFTAEQPPDRFAFARRWLDEHAPRITCWGCHRATIERHSDGRWFDYGTDTPHTCHASASRVPATPRPPRR